MSGRDDLSEVSKVPQIEIIPQSWKTAPPSGPYDDRPAVADLLAENSAEVAALRRALESYPLFDTHVHDELWLLRYILSHKKSGVAAAAAAARHTLEWRRDNRIDELSAALRSVPLDEFPPVKYAHSTHVEPDAVRFVQPNASRGPLALALLPGFNFNKAASSLSQEEYSTMLYCINEWFFLACDRATRETGRLTKSCRLLNCKGFSTSRLNRAHLKMDGAIGKKIEDCYPQLLGSIIILDVSPVVLVLWRAVKYFFPKRFVEKMDMISSSSRTEMRKRVLRYVAFEDLPDEFGGTAGTKLADIRSACVSCPQSRGLNKQ